MLKWGGGRQEYLIFDMQYRHDSNDSAQNDSEESQPSSLYFQQEEKQTIDSQPSTNDHCCHICGLRYSCQSSLQLHMRTRHRHTNFPTRQFTTFAPKQYSSQFADQESIQPPPNRPFGLTPNTTHPINQKQSQKLICQYCGGSFSYKSSLRLHIRRKHPDWKEGLELEPRRHTKSKMMEVECPICGTICPSRTALEIHNTNKHQPPNVIRRPPNQAGRHLPATYDEEGNVRVQQCGCGHVYSSRSALNLHVRKKHNGVYPQGSTKALPAGKPPREVQFNKQVEDYLRAQRSASEDSIYDSDSENLPQTNRENQQNFANNNPQNFTAKKQQNFATQEQSLPRKEQGSGTRKEQVGRRPGLSEGVRRQEGGRREKNGYAVLEPIRTQVHTQARQLHKPFICGCGKSYTVSSSLNLHIKKAHNWVIPVGTIGGPRGLMGGQDEGELIKQHNMFHEGQSSIICSECGEPSDNSYFKCRTCLNHLLCSTCFWATNNFSKEHDWIVRDR